MCHMKQKSLNTNIGSDPDMFSVKADKYGKVVNKGFRKMGDQFPRFIHPLAA